jgi:hypothetical protein
VAAARERGVTVYDPDGPEELPPPGSVHIVVVIKKQMERCVEHMSYIKCIAQVYMQEAGGVTEVCTWMRYMSAYHSMCGAT